jgi:Predicted exporters of the RND superfamily
MKKIIAQIEARFEKLGFFIYAQPWRVILAALVLFGVLASQVPQIVIDTSNEAFLEPDDPILTQYDSFRDQFGRDEVVVVAIQPKDVFERQFLERLKAFHDDLESEVPYLDEVISLVNVTSIKGEEDELLVEELLEDWPEDEEGIAVLKKDVLSNKFYKNLLISEDGTFTTVIIRSNAFTGEDTLTEDSEFGEDMFEDEGGSDSAENSEVTTLDETPEGRITEQQNTEFTTAIESIVRRYTTPDFPTNVAGSPVMTGVLKDEMMSNIPRFTLMALGLIGILLLLLFRTPVGVFLPLLTVIMSLISAIGLMAVSGTPFTVVTQILPSLLLAVGVGYSVHLLTIYYHHLQRNGDKEKAIVFALGHSGLAILMTSLTTAGGLISFLPAPLAPVSALGLFGAIGVLLAVFYTLFFVPAVLAVLPVSKKTCQS